MQKFLFIVILFSCCGILLAQTKKTFVVNPGEKLVDKVPLNEIYRYPEFTMAEITMKSGAVARAKVNYNSIFSEMQFIDVTGDTLSIADEKNIREIAVGKDTFYFAETWVELTNNYNTMKIARHKLIEMMNKEKIGAMGIPGFGAIETNSKSSMSQHLRDLVANEKLTYTERITYFIGDRFNHFSKANKKGLMKIYHSKEKEIEKYLQENKVDFNNEDDLKKLSAYLQTL